MKTETNGGRMVARGDTFDIEDSRTSYRLSIAQGILRNMGLESTVIHSEGCADRKQALYGYNGCDDKCKTTWPEFATGRMFDLAYQLADEFQTQRGQWNQMSAEQRGWAQAAKS